MAQLCITAVGPDRAGLVGELSEHLFRCGANIADSRMVNLRGQFALLLLVEGAAEAMTRVRETTSAEAGKLGLAVSFAAEAPSPTRPGIPYRLKTYSMDQPGIVFRFSSTLKQHGINIEELSTRLSTAPFDGTALFTMDMRLSVPTATPIRELRAALDALCDAVNCDMDFEPV